MQLIFYAEGQKNKKILAVMAGACEVPFRILEIMIAASEPIAEKGHIRERRRIHCDHMNKITGRKFYEKSCYRHQP